MNQERESIWSVPSGLKQGYFVVFSVLLILSAVILALRTSYASDNVLDRWTEFLQSLGPIAIAIAAISIVATEMWRIVMVMAQAFQDWMKKRQDRKIAEAQQEFARRLRDMSESERLSEIERVANGDE